MEKELLQRFLELVTLNVDISKWSVANFKNNPPRLHSLQMFDSLFYYSDMDLDEIDR